MAGYNPSYGLPVGPFEDEWLKRSTAYGAKPKAQFNVPAVNRPLTSAQESAIVAGRTPYRAASAIPEPVYADNQMRSVASVRGDYAPRQTISARGMGDTYPGNNPYVSNNFTVMPKENFIKAGYNDAAVSGALKAAAARGDWDAVNRYYASRGESFAGMAPPRQRGAIDESMLYDRAFGSGVKSRAGRDRAAKMLSDVAQNRTLIDVQGLRNQGYMSAQQAQDAAALSRQEAQLKGQGALAEAAFQREKPYKEAAQQAEQRKLAATIAALEQTTKSKNVNAMSSLLDPAIFGRLDKNMQDALIKQLLGESGFEGYAQGGQVQPVLNPMGNMGMPSSMASLDPVIRQYGQYVSTATQYGLQPLPLTKFIDLMSSARSQLQQLPTQAGTMGMADGGMVDEPSFLQRLFGTAPSSVFTPTPQAQAGRGAALLGQGAASNTAKLIEERKMALEEALNAARGARMGYAGGGAVPVAGKQVLGPGTAKSDSIPAVVDGNRPAALSTGEFVFPTDTVQYFGTDKLNKMIKQSRGMK